MTLITILLALAAERLLSHLRRWREYDWFGRYLDHCRQLAVLEPLMLSAWGLALLVPPLLAVVVLQGLLHGGPLSLLGLVFTVLVLVFALGPRDLWEEVHALIRARREGDQTQSLALAADLAAVAGRRPRHVQGDALIRAVMVQGHERVFGVLLWFFVLGPLGAVLYRLAAEFPTQLRRQGGDIELFDIALRFHGLLAWVPIRVVALLYGLAGSTDGALAGWRRVQQQDASNWVAHGWGLLAATGQGALQVEQDSEHHRVTQGLDETLTEALGLISRTLIVLLAVLAAFTIGGWIT